MRCCRPLARCLCWRLRGDGGEVNTLFRDLLIGVTTFSATRRRSSCWAGYAAPVRGQERAGYDRMWVPGCATGEVYSIAGILREQSERPLRRESADFTTDIDEAAWPSSAHTLSGQHARGRLAGRLGRHRLRDRKPIRDLCVFSSHSVVRDPPFSRMDLISCHNLSLPQPRAARPRHRSSITRSSQAVLVSRNLRERTSTPTCSRLWTRRTACSSALPTARRRPLLCCSGVTPPAYARSTTAADGYAAPERRGARARSHAAPHVVVNREGDVVYYSAAQNISSRRRAGQPAADSGARDCLPRRSALHEAIESAGCDPGQHRRQIRGRYPAGQIGRADAGGGQRGTLPHRVQRAA